MIFPTFPSVFCLETSQGPRGPQGAPGGPSTAGPRGSQVARAPLQRAGLLPRADAGPGTGGRGTAVVVAAPAARGVPHYGGGAEGLEGLEGGLQKMMEKWWDIFGFSWEESWEYWWIIPSPLIWTIPILWSQLCGNSQTKAWFLKGDLPWFVDDFLKSYGPKKSQGLKMGWIWMN